MTPQISAELSQRVDAAERTMRILWLALMSSVALYGFVIYQLARNAESASSSLELPPFVPPIIALSLAAAGMILFRAMSAPERLRALLQVDRTPQDEAQVLPEAERRLSRVPPMLFTLYILRWAIFESIAVVGLVLGILQHSFETFLPYGFVALALIAMTPPQIKRGVIDAIPLLPVNVGGGSNGVRSPDA